MLGLGLGIRSGLGVGLRLELQVAFGAACHSSDQTDVENCHSEIVTHRLCTDCWFANFWDPYKPSAAWAYPP